MSLAAQQRETVARLLSGRAGEGEAVHAANIRSGLVETFRASFPVAEALVGSDYFRRLAITFSAAHPPERPILAEYGANLPAFLADHAVAKELPYLTDVARLEWLRQLAYFAADAESVAAEGLAALAEADRIALRLARHPSVGLLESAYPVYAIWAAHQPGGPALEEIDPAGAGECGAVYRAGAAVRHLPLDPVGIALLRAFDGGTALDGVLASLGERFDDREIGAALAQALRAGLLTS
ncbi:MAG: DNA-binding domain-containing protein [Proteobacteria bacterium]|nr:DNA-binding domain-containing protein [Pseudomonadota bacterium]